MRTFVLASVLALTAATGCSKDKAGSADQAHDNVPTMTVDEVDKGLAANELTAIDCNADKTRKKHGVIPGAVQIYDEETYAASELPADKGRKLVFYCSGPT